MQTVDIIRAKRDGQKLPASALKALIDGYTSGEVPDYQISAFLMAVVFQGMDDEELAAWTRAMLHSGDVFDLGHIPGPKVDKHSTGGVGDKVSMILLPLAVAAGLKVPMIAGRGLGHTGGTLDKLESIPGFDVALPPEAFLAQMETAGFALIGQTERIVPADRKLYALRDVTGTVQCIPLIASSIMSKKIAEGIDALVLDIKVGSGAFMKTQAQARELAWKMLGIGTQMGKTVRAVLTDMSQPLGQTVGNALEILECVEVLQGRGPADLIEVTLELTAQMLIAADPQNTSTLPALKATLRRHLHDGSALEIFRQLVTLQGGDPNVCDDPGAVLPKAAHATDILAQDSGHISAMDTHAIGMAGVDLGAGRLKKESPIDHAVGFVFHKKLGDSVNAGDPLLTVQYNDHARLQKALSRLQGSIQISSGQEVQPPPLVLEVISG